MPDLRAVALGLGAWAGALLVLLAPARPALAAVAAVVVLVVSGVVRGWWALGWLGPLAALVAVAGVAALQHVLLATSPLAALADETRKAVAAGESLGDAAPRIGARLGDGWALSDVFSPRNATTAFHELEWE